MLFNLIILCLIVVNINFHDSVVVENTLSIEQINTVFDKIDQSFNGQNNSEYKPEKEFQSQSQCSSDKLLNKLFLTLTPDDYEEGQNMDMYGKVKNPKEFEEKIQRLDGWTKNISKTFEPILNRLQMRLSENLMFIDLPQDCIDSLVRIGQAFNNREVWALQFIETIPYRGSSVFPSVDYDSCLLIKSSGHHENLPVIRGQYCPLHIPKIWPTKEEYTRNPIDQNVIDQMNLRSRQIMDRANISQETPGSRMKRFETTKKVLEDIININELSDSLKLPLGLCLPTTCSPKDIEYAINKIIYPIIQLPIVISNDCDYVDKPIELNDLQMVSVLIFSMFISLVLVSTLMDLILNYILSDHQIKNKATKIITEIIQSFSAIPNFKDIFWSNRTNKRFLLLDGIRTVLSFTVLFCHTMQLSFLTFHIRSMTYLSAILTRDKYIYVKNVMMIDTFFFVAGLMTCYVMISKLYKSNGSFNYIKYVLFRYPFNKTWVIKQDQYFSNRYLRIIPATIGSVLLIFIYPLFGNGPMWNLISSILYLPCRDNWLPTLLMTSNFDIVIPNRFICNTGNWSISADFQMYLLAPIVFLGLYKFPRFGIIWNIFFIFVGVFICMAPKLIWNIPYLLEFSQSDSIFYFANLVIIYYYRFESHLVSYVFGMFCGYLIRQKPDINFGGRVGELIIWILSWTLTFGSMYWSNFLWDPYYVLKPNEVLLFLGFSKLFYLSGWFWMIYACATGRGGFVNKFFSWKGFKATGYLSFEICVLHPMVMFYRLGTNREPVIYSDYYVWTLSFFDYLAAFLMSVLFHIVVSGPFANLVNILIKRI